MVTSAENKNTRLAPPIVTDSVPLEPALPPEPLAEELVTLAGGAVAIPCTPPVTAPVSVS